MNSPARPRLVQLETRCVPAVSVDAPFVNDNGDTEFRLIQDGFQLGTILYTKSNEAAFRPHPDLGDPNGFGSTFYFGPYLGPPGGGLPGGLPLADTPIVTANTTNDTFTVQLTGAVNRSPGVNFGTWSENLTLAFDSMAQTIHADGTLNVSLDGTLASAGADLNLGKIASNYLTNVPRQVGGPGNTGDMDHVDVLHSAGASPTVPPNFTWVPTDGSTFPSDTSAFLQLNVAGQRNTVDTLTLGEGFQIAVARKPSLNVAYTSVDPADGLSAGLSYDTASSQDFSADNVEAVAQVRKTTTTHTSMTFGIALDAALPATIEITQIPPYGTDGFLTGKVTGVDFTQYVVQADIQIDGVGWYPKPTDVAPTVPIASNGTFSVDVATGGIDNRATVFAVQLIPRNTAATMPTEATRGTFPENPSALAADFKESHGRTLEFEGRTWGIKESPLMDSAGNAVVVGPGGNRFSDLPTDVFVDPEGQLHLSINKRDNVWWATEVYLLDTLGYGTYSVRTSSDVSLLAGQNVTAGYYTYDVYGDDDAIPSWPFREIDIEDRYNDQNLSDTITTSQWVVQPPEVPGNVQRFTVGNDPALTRSFTWAPTQIDFQTSQGTPSSFTYTANPAANHLIPTTSREKFRLNLWLNSGATQPTSGQRVELVISDFTFTPLTNAFPPTIPSDDDTTANLVIEAAVDGTPVGIAATSADPEKALVTYSLTDDAGGRFAIDPQTGVVTVANASRLNFEDNATHAITVQASDGVLVSSKTFDIAVANANPSIPMDTNSAANSVVEAAANGTTVGITAFATDPNGPAVTYSLVDDAGGRFAITASTGVVTVADGSLLNFETAPSHSITVQASDGAGGTSSQIFTVAVTNTVPPPPPPPPPPATAAILAVGEPDGSVRIVNANNGNVIISNFRPLDTPGVPFAALVTVAMGDLDGDSVADVWVAPSKRVLDSSGNPAPVAGKVFVFSGAELAAGRIPATPIHTFLPFGTNTDGTSYDTGLEIATGDLDGDGKLDLVAGSRGDVGRFTAKGVGLLADGSEDPTIGDIVTPFPGYVGKVIVSAGNFDGDPNGEAEIAAIRAGKATPAAAMQMEVFRTLGAGFGPLDLNGTGAGTALVPFATIFQNGSVTAVDPDGDGQDQLVFAAQDQSNSANVQVRVAVFTLDGSTGNASPVSTGVGVNGSYLLGSAVQSFSVTKVDLNRDGSSDLAVALQTPTSGQVLYLDPLSGAQLQSLSVNILGAGVRIAIA